MEETEVDQAIDQTFEKFAKDLRVPVSGPAKRPAESSKRGSGARPPASKHSTRTSLFGTTSRSTTRVSMSSATPP